MKRLIVAGAVFLLAFTALAHWTTSSSGTSDQTPVAWPTPLENYCRKVCDQACAPFVCKSSTAKMTWRGVTCEFDCWRVL